MVEDTGCFFILEGCVFTTAFVNEEYSLMEDVCALDFLICLRSYLCRF